MTLLIAGYDHDKSIDYGLYDSDSKKSEPKMEVSGLFVVADSAITQNNGKTLLTGFRKAYEMEAKLWKPYFMPHGSFSDYHEVYERRNFFIGFAGNTLTAQHILNSITTHLENLRISYTREDHDPRIKYNVIRHCQINPLEENSITSYWNEDTFLNSDFVGLLTGDIIALNIEHSINHALKSARKHKLDENDYRSLHTDLVSGVWCPYKKRFELYVYKMESRTDTDGILQPFTQRRFIKANDIVVLGMQGTFEARAKIHYQESLNDFKNTGSEMYRFIEIAIDETHQKGSGEIDRPISHRKLDEYKIERVK